MANFNNRIRQIILLIIILMIAFLIVKELYGLLPGFLGAITFYIIGRNGYFKLVEQKKWKKGWTALMFILGFLILIGLPFILCSKACYRRRLVPYFPIRKN